MAEEEFGLEEELGPFAGEVRDVARGLRGCLPASLAGVVVIIAIVIWAIGDGDLFGGDKDRASTSCEAHGELVLISFRQDCPADEETTTTATTEAPAGETFAPPAPEDVPAGAQLFEGTSGGELGCITCDGASRFIHITNSTTAVGDAQRAAQEIVWPEGGEIIDFGVNIPGPNRARYGFNLFTNGEYGNGCGMEIGQTSCRMNQPPTRLEQGDRVTIIVGEGGITNPDGTPANVGAFIVEWWFVFQPDD